MLVWLREKFVTTHTAAKLRPLRETERDEKVGDAIGDCEKCKGDYI